MNLVKLISAMSVVLAISTSCNSQKDQSAEHEFTNELINETSPYLLQHAHNPVNWKPWNEQTLAEAKEKNKLMLISIGYAACHWCHVMEHESFEDSTVAAIMNKDYINIKIDKEERPDVDQVYMSAVQLMTKSGGWPLNVVALPDGRPVWGGTYFPKDDWMAALGQIQKIYKDDPSKLEEYAGQLSKGMELVGLVKPNENDIHFVSEALEKGVDLWSQKFDYDKGGLTGAPKFMMPTNYHFLLRYAHQTEDKDLMKYVIHTLDQISYGGVYDHVGGGFSRYSVDEKWHVPHFEKMLYDNGQLVSLYSDAYLVTKNPWYKQLIEETLGFVERELLNDDGAFYSTLDADSLNSEGQLEEGAFYAWQEDELKDLLSEDYPLFQDYYNINPYGLWEKEHYVLIRKDSDQDFIKKHQLTMDAFLIKQKQWKQLLQDTRSKRSRPRLDDKTLTSWNGLMLKGYVDAYRVFGTDHFLEIALKNARFIVDKQLSNEGQLWHTYKDGKSTINGYLEDYAIVIDAFLSLYQNTGNEKWLVYSEKMAVYVQDHFYDEKSQLYFFTSNKDTALVTRNIEYSDNVIPASNSILAKDFFILSHLLSDRSYYERAEKMLHNIQPNFEEYPSGYSNWMDLQLSFVKPYYECVVTGNDAKSKVKDLQKIYIPNKLIAQTTKLSENPLFKGRFNDEKTHIFICENNACKFPVTEVTEALKLMN